MEANKPKHRIELLGQMRIALHVDQQMLVLQIPVQVDGSANLVSVPLAADEAENLIAMLSDTRAALARVVEASPKKH